MDNRLADSIRNLSLGEFNPRPYFDKDTNRLRIFFEDRRAYKHYVNQYLSLFLAFDDDDLVGIQIDSISSCAVIE